jgi:glycerol kinase
MAETTALGAAYAAGIAVGYWSGLDELRRNWTEGRRWRPHMDAGTRERELRNWRKAVTRTLDWAEKDS